jgi:hypothetical protein
MPELDDDRPATWLETLAVLTLWAAAGLLGVFATLVLYRVSNP